MKKNLVIGSLLVTTIMSAAAPAMADREAIGNIIGGIIGAAAGSKVGKGNGNKAAIIIGAIAGAVIGGQVGQDLDDNDRRQCADAQRRGLGGRLGERSEWRGQRSDAYGSFTTTREGYNYRTQEYCREYSSTIYARGRTEETRGYACTRSDGSWYEVQQTEVNFDRRGNGGPGYGGGRDRDRWDDNRPGRPGPRPGGPGRNDDYRPAPPSRGDYDRVVVREITRRTGGEWVRLSLRRPVDVSSIEIRHMGADLRVHEVKAYSANGRQMDLRSYRERSGYSIDVRMNQVTTVDVRLESMGGYADVEFTVNSDYGRPSVDATRF